jgi:hypothetical protein
MILRINSDSNDDNEENTTMDSLNEKKKLTRFFQQNYQ